ncbi:MAG: hypothetical protein H6Q58_393 [Firmicutes bacterium]|nr:hypothetical protein [Bacillota bacterium]
MKEYKVLTRKDKLFAEKFNPETFEVTLNAYAQQGWRVVSVTSGYFPEFSTADGQQELIAVLERDVDERIKLRPDMSESRLYDNLVGI